MPPRAGRFRRAVTGLAGLSLSPAYAGEGKGGALRRRAINDRFDAVSFARVLRAGERLLICNHLNI